jgi:hypothetical protein
MSESYDWNENDDAWSRGPKRKGCRNRGKYADKLAAQAAFDAANKKSRLPKSMRPAFCRICRAWHGGD